jgi:HSP20 family protein
MNSRDLSRFMWNEALSMLDQADRLHRQFFRPAAARAPTWEPPVDVLETANGLRVTVALPGVAPESITLTRQADTVTISAHRPFPLGGSAGDRRARVHALEIPHGRFERTIAIPSGAFSLVEQAMDQGCLTLLFSRKDTQ